MGAPPGLGPKQGYDACSRVHVAPLPEPRAPPLPTRNKQPARRQFPFKLRNTNIPGKCPTGSLLPIRPGEHLALAEATRGRRAGTGPGGPRGSGQSHAGSRQGALRGAGGRGTVAAGEWAPS